MKAEEPRLTLDDTNLYWALCFEVGLGVFALGCGYFTSVWPAEHLKWPPEFLNTTIGLLSALPMLAVVLAALRIRWRPIQDFHQLIDDALIPMFSELNVRQLAMLSIAAGLGEELLFRGLIQAEIAQGTNVVIGILMASFVFGLVHFMSPAYFMFAFAVSVYLGALYWYFESLWVPMTGHAAYDFLMLIYLQRKK